MDYTLKIANDKEEIVLSDYKKQSLRNVLITLENKNILIDTLIYEYSDTYKRDSVIDQYPKAGKSIESFEELAGIPIK